MYIQDGRQVGRAAHRQTWIMIRSMRKKSAGRQIDRSGDKYSYHILLAILPAITKNLYV